MRALRVTLTAAILVTGFHAPAGAWTGPTRARMVDDAIKLMPPTLRQVLEKRRKDVVRGMLEPMTQEDAAGHRPSWDRGGTLDASVDRAARSVVDAVGKTSFRDVARRFGALAHYVADAGFPPGASGGDGARYAHFGGFCESRMARFPLVFYGHDNAALAKSDFKRFTAGVLQRARDEDATLAKAYAAAASWNDPVAFDDRSVPFAMGSLAYSHAVTDIVQAWLAAWALCHGDLGGTPYKGKAK